MKSTNHRRLASRKGGVWKNESLNESFGSHWANKVKTNASYKNMKVFFELECMSTCCWGLPKPKYEPFITHNRGTLNENEKRCGDEKSGVWYHISSYCKENCSSQGELTDIIIEFEKSLFVREQEEFVRFVGLRAEICQMNSRQRCSKSALSELHEHAAAPPTTMSSKTSE